MRQACARGKLGLIELGVLAGCFESFFKFHLRSITGAPISLQIVIPIICQATALFVATFHHGPFEHHINRSGAAVFRLARGEAEHL